MIIIATDLFINVLYLISILKLLNNAIIQHDIKRRRE